MPDRTRTLGLAVTLILSAIPTWAQTVDLAALAHVDAHVEATPPKAETSIPELADYLAAAGDTEMERARAVYQWVSSNIAYDVSGFSSGDYGDLSPESVLRRRTAVCSGYAGLAASLGRAMGLEIEVVSGWSKGYGYQAGAAIGQDTNHAWNVVRIDGEWRLMDPTWGAGYIDGQMDFVRRAQDHYFLTDPEAFILDHFPEDPRWQLLDEPVTRTQYGEMVFIRPHFFAHGLEIRSHTYGRIVTDDRATVTLGAPEDIALLASVVEAETGRELDRTRTFVQMAQGEARIDAVFPRHASYLLRLFVKRRGDDGSYQWALDYRVEALAGDEEGSFPLAFTAFSEGDVLLLEPMDGTLEVGQSRTFRLTVPGASTMAVRTADGWHPLTREGDTFSGNVTVAEGEITVFAKFEEDGQFQGLLRYAGR